MLEDCLCLGELSGFPMPQVTTRADLAKVYGGLGAIEQSLETIRLALPIAETHFPFYRAPVLGMLAQFLFLQGNFARNLTNGNF